VRFAVLLVFALASCSSPPPAGVDAGAGGRDGGFGEDGGVVDDGGASNADAGTCPTGLICVDSLPFHDDRDTSTSPLRNFSSYSCAPSTNESGPEYVYRVILTAPGILGARVADGSFADIDLHFLSALDAQACIARDDTALSRYLEPGTYYVVADTYVDASGVEHVGAYGLDITFTPVAEIACATKTDPLPRAQGDVLQMPATGPVVQEAHLVTPSEPFDGGWPSSATDGLDRHYTLSEATSHYLMNRHEVWAPFGEGGSMWGQGSSSKPPLSDEAWYVNMYWRTQPARATRMIIRQPDGGLAVVVAAGYETGPGSVTAIGGATEEIHNFLGTVHRSTLTMGFAVDQSLPFGPVRCAP
jgi:hypothetical protein